jgi:hypothetical protein
MNFHLHLVLRLMCGATLPLPYTPSWRGRKFHLYLLLFTASQNTVYTGLTAVLVLSSNASLHEELSFTSLLSKTNGLPSYAAARASQLTRSEQPTVHYRIHKRPPLVSTGGQSNPIHDSQSHFIKIHFNIIIPPIPRSYNLSLLVRFPNQTL